MPIALIDDGMINELLKLARISTADAAARRWMGDALLAARATAAGETRPFPARHNVPLDRIARDTDRLVTALDELRRHSHAHGNFWRFAAFGPVHDGNVERVDVMSTLKTIRYAAHSARESRTGRPKNVRKQNIVDLALAFCARFSPAKPSSDINNFFQLFAERFFEHATGLSLQEGGHGIDRQVKVALRRLPIEAERARLLNETRRK